MKKILIVLLSAVFFQLNVLGQVKKNTVRTAILSADTVLIVSHTLTYADYVRQNGDTISPPMIIENDKPNKTIIRETVILNDSAKLELIKILTEPNKTGYIEMAGCFLPHHAILLIKSKKTLFIEICFGCQRLLASAGIGIDDIQYPKQMWEDLESFFSLKGIKYQIPFRPDEQ